MGIDARMLVRTKTTLTDDELRKLSYRISEAFYRQPFWLARPGEFEWEPTGRHALSRVPDNYEQDGDPIQPVQGETLIEVHLKGRFYGKGYERGDLPTICAIAEWLEANIPESEIWYGGDSSGVTAMPFGPRERKALKAHFHKHGHLPYTSGFDMHGDVEAPKCDFCHEPMLRFGFGGSYAGFTCVGCGKKMETRDGGKTWTEGKEEEA